MNAMTEGRYRLIGSTASRLTRSSCARCCAIRRIPFDLVIMTKALRRAISICGPI
jgi:hypothetical protein